MLFRGESLAENTLGCSCRSRRYLICALLKVKLHPSSWDHKNDPIFHPNTYHIKGREAEGAEVLGVEVFLVVVVAPTWARIPVPPLSSPTLCCVVDTARWKLWKGTKHGPSLPPWWPWPPDRYKSVGAGRHSSGQVNRGSSNPPGGPPSAPTQQRLSQMLTFANTEEKSGILQKQNWPFLGECCCQWPRLPPPPPPPSQQPPWRWRGTAQAEHLSKCYRTLQLFLLIVKKWKEWNSLIRWNEQIKKYLIDGDVAWWSSRWTRRYNDSVWKYASEPQKFGHAPWIKCLFYHLYDYWHFSFLLAIYIQILQNIHIS